MMWWLLWKQQTGNFKGKNWYLIESKPHRVPWKAVLKGEAVLEGLRNGVTLESWMDTSGLPWVSSSWKPPISSAAPHVTYCLDLSPVSLPFSGHDPATQCLSWSERPVIKTSVLSALFSVQIPTTAPYEPLWWKLTSPQPKPEQDAFQPKWFCDLHHC